MLAHPVIHNIEIHGSKLVRGGMHHQYIKKSTRDIADNGVITFVIFLMFWFLKQRRKIYQTFYISLSTIMGC